MIYPKWEPRCCWPKYWDRKGSKSGPIAINLSFCGIRTKISGVCCLQRQCHACSSGCPSLPAYSVLSVVSVGRLMIWSQWNAVLLARNISSFKIGIFWSYGWQVYWGALSQQMPVNTWLWLGPFFDVATELFSRPLPRLRVHSGHNHRLYQRLSESCKPSKTYWLIAIPYLWSDFSVGNIVVY